MLLKVSLRFLGVYISDNFTVGILFLSLIVVWPIVLCGVAIIFGAFGLVWVVGNGGAWIIGKMNRLFDRIIK